MFLLSKKKNNFIWKGGLLEAGYIYAPYIPLQIIENENDFKPRVGLKSRYSEVTVNNNFYGTVNVK